MTKSQDDRRLDFSQGFGPRNDPKTSMKSALVRFVGGYRGPRENAVNARQIREHFRATPWTFVNDVLLDMIARGELRCCRNGLSRQAGTVYELPRPGSEVTP
jgi:hypothetical protein